ncbi:RNA recognition motif (RRM, RBD, or RNP domain) [Novymonas esmeraldas]|uniref:RNA recognition motif (RRM, RBD, or RNP domain) n=1 Tax=Novymonas esmeraldas TaxID=1808958 RepID=A0AAW0EQE7_9TRYP
MDSKAILFVSNISAIANAQYLERLFSAYGTVLHVELFGEGPHRYAEVTYSTVDDADAAVAALHCHYQTCRNLPMIVLYSKNSPAVSVYGHQVGEEFMKAAEEKRPPLSLPLDEFDGAHQRLGVQAPPSENAIIREHHTAGY